MHMLDNMHMVALESQSSQDPPVHALFSGRVPIPRDLASPLRGGRQRPSDLPKAGVDLASYAYAYGHPAQLNRHPGAASAQAALRATLGSLAAQCRFALPPHRLPLMPRVRDQDRTRTTR